MKFPRTLRLDSSDVYVFERAAEPGEWAVPGTFAFVERDPADLEAKEKLAFASGWLGTDSFGHASMIRRKSGSIGPLSSATAPDSAPPASETLVFPVVSARCSSPVAPIGAWNYCFIVRATATVFVI